MRNLQAKGLTKQIGFMETEKTCRDETLGALSARWIGGKRIWTMHDRRGRAIDILTVIVFATAAAMLIINLLSACGPTPEAAADSNYYEIGPTAKRISILGNWHLYRVIDDELGNVCYIMSGNSPYCMPLPDSYDDGR
jgi:hypothetical protein